MGVYTPFHRGTSAECLRVPLVADGDTVWLLDASAGQELGRYVFGRRFADDLPPLEYSDAAFPEDLPTRQVATKDGPCPTVELVAVAVRWELCLSDNGSSFTIRS